MQNNNTSPFEYITTRMNTLLHSDWTFFLLKGYSESAFFIFFTLRIDVD